MTKWIESPEATMLALKYGIDYHIDYQAYLDKEDWAFLVEHYDDDPEPLSFEDWVYEFDEQILWENSDEFQRLIGKC